MTQLVKKLDKKLATWRPEVVAQVEQIVTEVMQLEALRFELEL